MPFHLSFSLATIMTVSPRCLTVLQLCQIWCSAAYYLSWRPKTAVTVSRSLSLWGDSHYCGAISTTCYCFCSPTNSWVFSHACHRRARFGQPCWGSLSLSRATIEDHSSLWEHEHSSQQCRLTSNHEPSLFYCQCPAVRARSPRLERLIVE